MWKHQPKPGRKQGKRRRKCSHVGECSMTQLYSHYIIIFKRRRWWDTTGVYSWSVTIYTKRSESWNDLQHNKVEEPLNNNWQCPSARCWPLTSIWCSICLRGRWHLSFSRKQNADLGFFSQLSWRYMTVPVCTPWTSDLYFEAQTPSCFLLCLLLLILSGLNHSSVLRVHELLICIWTHHAHFQTAGLNPVAVCVCVFGWPGLTRSIFRLKPVWSLNQQTEDITAEGQSARRPGGGER